MYCITLFGKFKKISYICKNLDMNKKNVKRWLIVSVITAGYMVILQDWVWGLAIGVSFGVVFTDDNDKTCCK